MAGDYELKAKGRILRFDGWTKVLPQLGKNPEDQILPAVSLNETLALKTVSPSQHFTKPPARFTEAALVKELEKRGIGRPSTYAAIISTIQQNSRRYAKRQLTWFRNRLPQIRWVNLLENPKDKEELLDELTAFVEEG